MENNVSLFPRALRHENSRLQAAPHRTASGYSTFDEFRRFSVPGVMPAWSGAACRRRTRLHEAPDMWRDMSIPSRNAIRWIDQNARRSRTALQESFLAGKSPSHLKQKCRIDSPKRGQPVGLFDLRVGLTRKRAERQRAGGLRLLHCRRSQQAGRTSQQARDISEASPVR